MPAPGGWVPAPGFYARFGYQECGRTPAYPRGYDQIHLVKRLS